MTAQPEELDPDIDVQVDEPPLEGYSIRIVARKTGFSVDSLRMWERRYGFPTPARNSVGNRIYSESDVERLCLIGKAVSAGYKTGEAIRAAPEALGEWLRNRMPERHTADAESTADVEPLIDRLSAHDSDGLRRELRRLAGALGAQAFITKVAAPLADTVGDAWQRGELHVHHEHLMTELLTTELRLLGVTQESPSGPMVLLGTLPREHHGLGNEMVMLYLRTLGMRAQVLGTDLPPLELVRASSALRAQVLGISVSLAAPPAAVHAQLQALALQLPSQIELWLGGKGAALLPEHPARAHRIATLAALEAACRRLTQDR